MSNRIFKGSLLATTVIAGLVIANPAYAQDASNLPGTQTAPEDETSGPDPDAPASEQAPLQQEVDTPQEIIVTGTLLRRTNTETPSPVTVLSAESLDQRGINTAAEAVQRLSANNAGTIQDGWNVGFNFATGATAPSLRGLTVQNTLTIFDGLRMAPYPLADDGQRNFVDMNTIPNAIIDRIEILRDGASSTYGADAIAGVINVITKREIQGLHLNGSYGISERGDAEERRFDISYGVGDLARDGYNFYISGEYQDQDGLFMRDRGFPFNTQDLSSICNAAGSCMSNLNWNGISADGAYNGLISIPGVALVRPVSGGNPNTGAGRFEFLNPAAGCRGLPEVHPASSGTTPFLNDQLTSCEVNFNSEYLMLRPDIKRRGLAGRVTVDIDGNHEIYAMANMYITETHAFFTPLGFNGLPTPPRPADIINYQVMLPVYVCATGVGTTDGLNTGCDATNGVLNPYNPYAEDGQTAQMFFRSTRPREIETKARSLRAVIGATGTILGDVDYSASFVTSNVRLDRKNSNNYIPQRIMNAVARGEFNFFDPLQTPESVWDYIGPVSEVTSTSDLYQLTGTLSREFFALPGGMLSAAVGAQYRREAIDAPSANPASDPITGNPYERYYGLNAVGTDGSRDVKSAYFEVYAPFTDVASNGFGAELTVSGRYDKYSTGQDNFSPKVGVKVTPVRQLALRGTWSKGFRIPSFNEAFGLPTTGYVTQGGTGFCNDYPAFCAAHDGNAYAANPFPLGLTQTGNPNLDPEKSTNITAGIIFEPIRNVSFTVDYWDIKVKDLIVGVTTIGPVLDAYYLNNGVVNIPGFNVIPATPDPAFPNALPHIGFIESSYKNANSQIARGIDLGASIRWPFFDRIKWTTYAEASYLLKYVLTPEDSPPQRYDGTLSPCNVTSCSGAPKWRASMQNTLDFGATTVTATVYYTKGLDLASTDFGGVRGDCEASIGASVPAYQDGTPVMCRSKDIWNVDLTAAHTFSDRLTVYANMMNVFDTKPPFDHAAAYGLYNFNPAFAGPNIMGRYFRLGAKISLEPRPVVVPEPVYAPPPPPPPAPPPATQTCADGSVILATDMCPAPPPPPPPPAPEPERG
ncbi:MAG TPA: TonB-dependent receptor [Sphingomicrobium sp.]|nr:TonB-dependent receptor [Sphingomicrobium sp.]